MFQEAAEREAKENPQRRNEIPQDYNGQYRPQ